MTLRLTTNSAEIQPFYDENSGQCTLVFHAGGKFMQVPEPRYIGGYTFTYDYVEVDELSLLYMDELCNENGLVGFKKYHVLGENEFVLLQTDRALYNLCNECPAPRVLDLYVEPSLSVPHSQAGSSNAAMVESNTNIGGGDGSDESNGSGDSDDSDDSGDSDYFEEEDSDYDMNELDDEDYDANVNLEAEYGGLSADTGLAGKDSVNDEGNENNRTDEGSLGVDNDESDLQSLQGSDDDTADNGAVIFNVKRDMQNPDLFIGLRFTKLSEFKEAVKNYSIIRGREIHIYKSEKTRCAARCVKDACPWNVNVALNRKIGMFEIRKINDEHKCSFTVRNRNVKSSWIAKKYMHDFDNEPNPNMTNFRKKVMQEVRCCISKSQAYRARERALQLIWGSQEDQYALVWNYVEEMRSRDNTATILVKTHVSNNDEIPRTGDDDIIRDANIPLVIDRPRFQRMYCCFTEMKKGMVTGNRKIFGIDGCHLKGKFGGVLLTAVGLDPNNNLYPIAHAAVESETRDSWTWFLNILRADLGLENDYEWTIISDKQKGLIQACEEVFPAAEHRFCVRHLHNNLALAGFKGENLKNLMYAAARSTTVDEFKKAMKNLRNFDSDAAKWLEGKPPSQWSNSHFTFMPKCDMLLNNVCESYNKVLNDAREMPILSLFEWIRNYHMVRFQENRERAQTRWEGKKICPKAQRRLHKNIEQSADCIPFKADVGIFQCDQYDGMKHCVNLLDKSCSCRRWELTGIPCSHACAAFAYEGKDPVDFVDECYSVNTYLSVYALAIKPAVGLQQLRESAVEPILPPIVQRRAGRPKKLRRMSKGEEEMKKIVKERKKGAQKLGRAGIPITCNLCKKVGHNKRTCPDRISSQKSQPSAQDEVEQGQQLEEQERTSSRIQPSVTKEKSKGDQKIGRSGLPIICSTCKKAGHNKRTCPDRICSQQSQASVQETRGLAATMPGQSQPEKRPHDVEPLIPSQTSIESIGLARNIQAVKHKRNDTHQDNVQLPKKTQGSPLKRVKRILSTNQEEQASIEVEHAPHATDNVLENDKQTTLAPIRRVTRSLSLTDGVVGDKEKSAMRLTRSVSSTHEANSSKDNDDFKWPFFSAEEVPKVWPFYRTLKDNPRSARNFWFKNGKLWFPRSMIKEAMAAAQKTSFKDLPSA